MRRRRRHFRGVAGRVLSVMAALALLLAACGGDETTDPRATATEDDQTGAEDEGTEEPVVNESDDQENTVAAAPGDYPRRPIELTVVYPAGGGMDVTARALAAAAEDVIGYEFRVVNREGAAGLVGHSFLANQAEPDGYNIGVVANTLFEDVLLRAEDFGIEDFDPLAFIGFDPVMWVVRTDGPFADASFADILAEAENDPGGVDVGIVPNITFDFVTQIVSRDADVEFNTVPFDGGAPSITALLGGNLDVSNAFYAEIASHLEAGTLRVVAVSDSSPDPRVPDAVPMTEEGIEIPPRTFGAARFLTVPTGMDPELKQHLSESFLKVLESPEGQAEFEALGVPLQPAGQEETEEFVETAFSSLEAFLRSIGQLD